MGWARTQSGMGVTARLIALVMLPVTVMCVLAGLVVVSHRSTATQATAVERGVMGLSDLVALRDALHVQQSVEVFEAAAAQLGLSPIAASNFVGFDMAGQILPARERAHAAATSLGAASPVSATDLRALSAAIDGEVISPAVAVDRLGSAIEASSEAVTLGLDRLEGNAREASLLAALESLRAASDLVDGAPSQIIDLSAVWFQAHGDTPQTTGAALGRLGAETADYTAAGVRLRQLGVRSVVASLGRVDADRQAHAFDQAVAATLLGTSVGASSALLDSVQAAGTFSGYRARDTLLSDVVVTASTAVRAEARRLAAAGRHGFTAWALGAAAASLASVAIALRLAYSIRKPLKGLAAYAQAINEGQLDAEPAASCSHGPRETRVAFRVFGDLVANLQLLDAKANALAHCEFDNPVLGELLPGRLGLSLESSVAVLSGSIVERDALQTNLAYEATHDSLTGICNRPAAILGIQSAVHRAARSGATTAVLFVALNEFKAVNDSHGHKVGDEVLRQVAARMTADLQGGDFVARLGGDEFVVVAEDIGGVDGATDLAHRLIVAISEPIETDGLRVTIGAAVGIALSLDGPEAALHLLARADAAMHRAKRRGNSIVEIFDAELQQQMIEREDVEAALSVALRDPAGGGLCLQYQPVVDAVSGALVGAEALIRWDRSQHGLLSPDSFIPIAEATSLIVDIDCWVLNEATRQLAVWSTVPALAEIPVAVNISGRHLLSHRLAEHLRGVLDDTGLDPRRLTIEITETVLLTDLVSAAAELDLVRALGIKVAIDDFGTGYTSLAHLQQLPVDILKIDRSFISQLDLRRGNSLVRMVTDLGHAIDMSIVAEGVETTHEMQALQAIGADHLQGYLLSRPLDPDALVAWAYHRLGSDGQRTFPAA